jgi:hypothetical protein
MRIVPSIKKTLEINKTYLQWQRPRGGGDKTHDATASGGGGKVRKPRSFYVARDVDEKLTMRSSVAQAFDYMDQGLYSVVALLNGMKRSWEGLRI